MDGLTERLSQAEIDIDGANAAIELKASKDDLDAVSLRLDGAERTLTAKADIVRVEAIETEITGLVKVEDIEAHVLKVLQYADLSQADLDVGYLDASSAQIATLDTNSITTNFLSVGGKTFNPDDYVTSGTLGNYATRSWVIENYATVSDISQTLDGYVMQGELDGYATEAWVRENFSKASATYKPTVIERYGSVSGTSIPVQTLNESGTVLLTGTVDAGDVYDSGYSSGNRAGFSSGYNSGYTAGQASIDTGAYYDEGYEAGYTAGRASVDTQKYYDDGYAAGYQAAKDATTVTGGIRSITNPAQGYYMATGWANALVDGEEVDYTTFSKSQQFAT